MDVATRVRRGRTYTSQRLVLTENTFHSALSYIRHCHTFGIVIHQTTHAPRPYYHRKDYMTAPQQPSTLSADDLINTLMTTSDVGSTTATIRTKLHDVNVTNCALLLAAHVVDHLSAGDDVSSVLHQYDFEPFVVADASALVHASTMLHSSLSLHGSEEHPRLLAQLAGYLGNPLMVEWCRILTTARGELDEDQYLSLLTITTGVQEVLAHPELLEGNDQSLDALRRREARELTTDTNAQQRIDAAPSTYVLSHQPHAIARHVVLAEPTLPIGRVRTRVYETTHTGEWLIDIVTHDMPGLLARITATLSSHNMDIINADLATWPDGTVIDSFIIRCSNKPDERVLAELIEQSFDRQLDASSHETRHFTIHYNDTLLPWHTVVTVTGRDSAGALQAIAQAFAEAEINVHHAQISGDGTMMSDRFEVSDFENKPISLAHRQVFESLLSR
jgi:predicted amino acid-binding ACT domain protein